MHDVLIIGSGVIGMSIARQLNQSHLDIAIVDRDIPGMHASYKAGGMLGAQNEFTTDSELFQLAVASRSLFPELSDALYHETGIDIEFQQSGLIKMASSTKDVKWLTQQYAFLKSKDPSVELLSDDELFNLSNGHVEPTDLAIYIPKDGQINANHYTKALLQSIIQCDVHRYYQTEVKHIHHNNGFYTVTTNNANIYAKKVIVAGGAWSTQLLKDYAIPRQVIGVKGEVLLVEQPS
ncbi:MAG: FAD-dependent oxidoreductase, partial [Staphylococcus warneri]|nr:FAD-dependent oxidoreductase [Staphylococcus warneri]